MKEKLISIITISGIIFQFTLVAFLCYMFYVNFAVNGNLNEMLLGVLTGLATGIGLANVVNSAIDKE
jgi:hypothetical protein